MKTKLVNIIFFIIVSYLQHNYFVKVFLKNDVISDLVVFLSIVFGFCVTSLSIFATSRYISKLYSTVDPSNKANTLLDTLIKKYKIGLFFTLTTIVYLLILGFALSSNSFESTGLSLGSFYLLPFGYLILMNFYYSYTLLSVLIKVVLQEAKSQN